MKKRLFLLLSFMVCSGLFLSCSGAKETPSDAGSTQEKNTQSDAGKTSPDTGNTNPDTGSNPDTGNEKPDQGVAPEQPALVDQGTPESQPPKGGKLVINELAAAGDPEDWFELYNGTNKSIDLSEYSVSDDLKDETKRKKFEKGTILKPGEYKMFSMNDTWPGFKLGKDEELGLYNAKGELVDSADWDKDQSPEKKSWGRSPDGTGPFKTLDTPTPGKKNQ